MSADDASKSAQRPHLTRRAFLTHASRIGLGAAGASLLAACGGAAAPNTGAGGNAPAAGGNATTISMMGWGSILEKENVQKGPRPVPEQEPQHQGQLAAYPVMNTRPS